MINLSIMSKILIIFCLFDLTSTVLLLYLKIIAEGNILLLWIIETYGIITFCVVKISTNITSIGFLEYAYKSEKLSRKNYARIVICILMIYLSSIK